ncbi:transposase, partial [Clostridium sp. UBA6640]|uniref:transposase n=1 Tax=Clostridium sp. UBA6640 TaxID=1946370 RepID=UPI0025B89DD2
FADAKEKHGMRFTHLRGLAKVKMEVTLIFSCMNLKKLANRLWNRRRNSSRLYTFICKVYSNNQKFTIKIPKGMFSVMRICLLSTV